MMMRVRSMRVSLFAALMASLGLAEPISQASAGVGQDHHPSSASRISRSHTGTQAATRGSGIGGAQINISPGSVDAFTAQGGTTNATLTIGNTGDSDLNWTIDEAGSPGGSQPSSFRDDLQQARALGTASTEDLRRSRTDGAAGSASAVILDSDSLSQMEDNTPASFSGMACGGQQGSTSPNSYWRRFYLSEHGSPSSVRIKSILVGTESGPSIPATVNVYSIPHSTPVDTIPTGALTLIGSGVGTVGGTLTTTTIPVTTVLTDAVDNDLVVEYHMAGASTQWYPAANATAETHTSFISAANCGLFQPTPMADTGHPDSHNIIVVNLDDGAPPSCGSPSDLPWARVNPNSGTTPPGGNNDVTVTFDATALSVGVYQGLLCVASNDADAATVEVPVSLTVTPDVICSAPLNHAIAADAQGSYFNWETGDAEDDPPAGAWHFNPYADGGSLSFNWGDNPIDAGVSLTPDGDWLVLSEGATIGAASPFAHASGPAYAYRNGFGGYLGFRFACAAGACYGYTHLQSNPSSGFPATLVDYCYNLTGHPITIGGGGGGGAPRISVAPTSLTTAVVPDGTTTAPLTIANIGRGDLTWSIGEAAPATSPPTSFLDDILRSRESGALNIGELQRSENPIVRTGGLQPNTLIDPFTLAQMADSTPDGVSGIACGVTQAGTTSANSYWRRFDLSENGSPASIDIRSVTVGTDTGPNIPATINLYAIAHSTPVDTIPTASLTLIGSGTGTVGGDVTLKTILVAATLADAVGNDLVVEYHIDGAPSAWFPAANGSPETHTSFISAADCKIDEPVTMAAAGAPNAHNIIVVHLDDGSPLPASCADPGDLPWASVSPSSGTLVPADASDATVTFDATGLARGTYEGLLCVSSNDPNTPVVEVPVSMRVTGGGSEPIAEVLPTAGFIFSVEQDTGDSAPLTIENIGAGVLTFNVTGAAATGSCANPGGSTWLTATPTSGSVVGGVIDDVAVNVDATGVAVGTYDADLCLSTNDTSHTLIAFPVRLIVTPAHVDNGIITSGALGHSVAETGIGTALNIVTSEFGDNVDIRDGTWDFNFVERDGTFALWEIGSVSGQYLLDNDGNAALLQPGDSIGPDNSFTSGVGGPVTMAAGWLAGVDGYLGVQFNCNGRLPNSVAGPCYGYVHIRTTGATGFPATILDTAFDGDNRAIVVVGSGPADSVFCDGFDGAGVSCSQPAAPRNALSAAAAR
jgi:hypothetical protein